MKNVIIICALFLGLITVVTGCNKAQKEPRSFELQSTGSKVYMDKETQSFEKPKIIKNSSLILLVKDCSQSLDKIQAIVGKYNGLIAEQRIYGEQTERGTIEIRIPADKFLATIKELKTLAIRVEEENINAEDITEEFHDTEAQLNNLKAKEQQFLFILKKANTVKDILEVTEKINEVRGEIDRIEGRLKVLSRKVEMSTINIQLKSDGRFGNFYWRPFYNIQKAGTELISGLLNYFDFMASFIIKLPLIALWISTLVLLGVGVCRGFMKVKDKFFKKKS